jgi:hypothetical protein
MDKEAAKRILTETFDAPFDESRFNFFALNLLNDVDTSKAFPFLSENDIHQSFKNHISKYRRLGSYTDSKGETIDVLVVHLKNEWALERSRTMLRNFTANYLENRGRKDSALVAYYTDNPDDWRFSYIRMDYKQELTESGKIKVKKELTPARRYSFLVGENEPNHTAQAQLLDILKEDKSSPTLSDLENAFSVDAVTKQFYLDYRDLYERLEKELNEILKLDQKIAQVFESQTIDTANFAKKLMGQIVFLYFLQKKGWLGVGKDENRNFKQWGSGPRNFLQRLFNKEFCDYQNFFNDVLEPLFYEALATERPNDIFSQYNCKIPFLSGGLFEPINDYNWEETDILIDNDIISDIIKTFNQYNFTVREDEPLEKEVAIDPEMLGKVFENLIEENEKKSKGAYYTPRSIVHNMCQESLINYLYTEVNNEISAYQEMNEKQLDVLGNKPVKSQLKLQTAHKNEIISLDDIETFIREGETILELESAALEVDKSTSVILESVKNNANKLDEALLNIKVCDPAIGSGAFAVGMLNEIVKARRILELYLFEEKTTYSMKRHFIQESIYGVDIDPGAVDIAKLRLWLSLVVDENDYNHIETLPNLDYKIMQGNSLIEEFHGISLNIGKKAIQQEDLFTGGSELDALIEDLHNKQTDFFNAEHPRDKKKKRQDVEIAIYEIFHSEITKVAGLAQSEKKVIEDELKEMTHGNKVRKFFPWKLYFADVFRKKGGFDVVIANPPYGANFNQNDKKILKAKFPQVSSKTKDSYMYFTLLGLNFLKLNGVLVYITANTWLLINSGKEFRKHLLLYGIQKIIDYGDDVFESAIVESTVFLINNIERSINHIDSSKVTTDGIKNYKINIDFVESDPYYRLIIGLSEKEIHVLKRLYGQNNLILFDDICTIKWGIKPYQTGHGKPPQTKQMGKDRVYHSNLKKDESWKPLVVGGNVNRYVLNEPKNQYIKYGNCLMYYSDENLILSKKILLRRTSATLKACLDTKQYYPQNSLFIIHSEKIDLKYLLCLLNSKLLNFIYSKKNPQKGKVFAEIMPSVIKELPIIQSAVIKVFVDIVDKILIAKKTNPEADTTSFEAEIDQLVYDLYGLTEEEISIVEESVG